MPGTAIALCANARAMCLSTRDALSGTGIALFCLCDALSGTEVAYGSRHLHPRQAVPRQLLLHR
eukprot:1234768-Rhodomonas_salina.1